MARVYRKMYQGHVISITPDTIYIDEMPIIHGIYAAFFYRFYASRATREDAWKLLEPYILEYLNNPTL